MTIQEAQQWLPPRIYLRGWDPLRLDETRKFISNRPYALLEQTSTLIVLDLFGPMTGWIDHGQWLIGNEGLALSELDLRTRAAQSVR
jgi:hypothetical protein